MLGGLGGLLGLSEKRRVRRLPGHTKEPLSEATPVRVPPRQGGAGKGSVVLTIIQLQQAGPLGALPVRYEAVALFPPLC